MTSERHDKIKRRNPDYISVINAHECAKININDIEIVEQDGRKIHIITPDRDYSFYGSINDVAISLADRAFYRILKSMIINLDHVNDISGMSVNFRSGQSMTFGRNSLNKIRKAYKRYLLRYPPYSLWDPVQLSIIGVNENVEGFIISGDESKKSASENN